MIQRPTNRLKGVMRVMIDTIQIQIQAIMESERSRKHEAQEM